MADWSIKMPYQSTKMPSHLLAVVGPDGTLLTLGTSGVGAWLRCKRVAGARVWKCAINSDDAVVVDAAPPGAAPDKVRSEGA